LGLNAPFLLLNVYAKTNPRQIQGVPSKSKGKRGMFAGVEGVKV